MSSRRGRQLGVLAAVALLATSLASAAPPESVSLESRAQVTNALRVLEPAFARKPRKRPRFEPGLDRARDRELRAAAAACGRRGQAPRRAARRSLPRRHGPRRLEVLRRQVRGLARREASRRHDPAALAVPHAGARRRNRVSCTQCRRRRPAGIHQRGAGSGRVQGSGQAPLSARGVARRVRRQRGLRVSVRTDPRGGQMPRQRRHADAHVPREHDEARLGPHRAQRRAQQPARRLGREDRRARPSA